MQEVCECRPDATQERGHRARHSKLLVSRRQVKRLHARRHKLRPPRDRREPKVRRHLRQGAQQLLDVRLVAGAMPAEDVGVHDDERFRHAAASR